MLHLFPIHFEDADPIWSGPQGLDRIHGWLGRLAGGEAEPVVASDRPEVLDMATDAGCAALASAPDQAAGYGSARLGPTGLGPTGLEQALGRLRRRPEWRDRPVIAADFRALGLTPRVLRQAAQALGNCSSPLLFVLVPPTDHPCQFRQVVSVADSGTIHPMDPDFRDPEQPDERFSLEFDHVWPDGGTKGTCHRVRQALVESRLEPCTGRGDPHETLLYRSGPGSARYAVHRTSPAARSGVLVRSVGEPGLELDSVSPARIRVRPAPGKGLFALRLRPLGLPGQTQDQAQDQTPDRAHCRTLDFSAAGDWLEIGTPSGSGGFVYHLLRYERGGAHDLMLPWVPTGAPWDVNAEGLPVRLDEGQVIHGRQAFPEMAAIHQGLMGIAAGVEDLKGLRPEDAGFLELDHAPLRLVRNRLDLLMFDMGYMES